MVSRLKNFVVAQSNFLSPSTHGTGRIKQIIAAVKNVETPEKFKGTFIEKWVKYWKGLYVDYKDVAIDTCKEFRNHPLKCSTYVSLMGSGFYLAKHTPDGNCFRQDFLDNSMKMIHVSEECRNPKTIQHLEQLGDYYSSRCIRSFSLGIISFIWHSNYNEDCALFKANCSYLQPPYLSFPQRIIDVGFCDTWWVLKDKMQDYDVNPEQWEI